jgi:hypothetical protein
MDRHHQHCSTARWAGAITVSLYLATTRISHTESEFTTPHGMPALVEVTWLFTIRQHAVASAALAAGASSSVLDGRFGWV